MALDLTDPQVIDLVHTIDDLTIDRATHHRAIVDGLALLDLALTALRNGSPDVTDEYLDRVITSLRRVVR